MITTTTEASTAEYAWLASEPEPLHAGPADVPLGIWEDDRSGHDNFTTKFLRYVWDRARGFVRAVSASDLNQVFDMARRTLTLDRLRHSTVGYFDAMSDQVRRLKASADEHFSALSAQYGAAT